MQSQIVSFKIIVTYSRETDQTNMQISANTIRHIESVKTKNFDPIAQFIVFGFIRNIEMLFAAQITMPSDIVYICLLYYCQTEYFTKHGSNIILRDNDRIIEHTDQRYMDDEERSGNTAYGNIDIDKNICAKYIWTFKLNRIGDASIAIGITLSYGANCECLFQGEFWGDFLLAYEPENNDTVCAYAYEFSKFESLYRISYDRSDGNVSADVSKFDEDCILMDGDEIKMVLDVPSRILNCYVNDIQHQDTDIEFDIDFVESKEPFRMAISLNKGAIINLINFETLYA
eukprot:413212_1